MLHGGRVVSEKALKKAIKETVSEKKRGRPQLMGDDDYALFGGIHPNITTRRGLQNLYYQGYFLKPIHCKLRC